MATSDLSNYVPLGVSFFTSLCVTGIAVPLWNEWTKKRDRALEREKLDTEIQKLLYPEKIKAAAAISSAASALLDAVQIHARAAVKYDEKLLLAGAPRDLDLRHKQAKSINRALFDKMEHSLLAERKLIQEAEAAGKSDAEIEILLKPYKTERDGCENELNEYERLLNDYFESAKGFKAAIDIMQTATRTNQWLLGRGVWQNGIEFCSQAADFFNADSNEAAMEECRSKTWAKLDELSMALKATMSRPSSEPTPNSVGGLRRSP